MNDQVYKLRIKHVILMLGICLFVVMSANIASWHYLKANPINKAVSRVWQKWQILERLSSPLDWLVLGDSSCGQGIRPDVLASELGGVALNLCTVANATVVNDAWMLQRYIERFGAPRKGVILFHVFHVWERDTKDFKVLFDQLPLTGRFWTHYLPTLELSLSEDLSHSMAPFISLWTSNLSVKKVIEDFLVSIWKGERTGSLSVSEAEHDLQFVMRHAGYVEEKTARPDKVNRDVAAHIAKYETKSFFSTPENEVALKVIIALSVQYRFPVYISHSSIAGSLYQNQGIQRFFSELNSFLDKHIASLGGGVVVFRVPPQYSPDQMDNVDHVVGNDNAGDLTKRLAQAVISTRTVPDK